MKSRKRKTSQQIEKEKAINRRVQLYGDLNQTAQQSSVQESIPKISKSLFVRTQETNEDQQTASIKITKKFRNRLKSIFPDNRLRPLSYPRKLASDVDKKDEGKRKGKNIKFAQENPSVIVYQQSDKHTTRPRQQLIELKCKPSVSPIPPECCVIY